MYNGFDILNDGFVFMLGTMIGLLIIVLWLERYF